MDFNTARMIRLPTLRGIVLGGITAVTLAASMIGFAGEASARPPRGNSQDGACTTAERNAARQEHAYFLSMGNMHSEQYELTGDEVHLGIAAEYWDRSINAGSRCF